MFYLSNLVVMETNSPTEVVEVCSPQTKVVARRGEVTTSQTLFKYSCITGHRERERRQKAEKYIQVSV